MSVAQEMKELWVFARGIFRIPQNPCQLFLHWQTI